MAVTATELRPDRIAAFLDIRCAGRRTTLLCGGLPYHRRLGDRKLDTLLVVRGETARSFRLGVGIDVPHPVAAAIEFLSPPFIVPRQPRPPITDRLAISSRPPERAGDALGAADYGADVASGGTSLSHRRAWPPRRKPRPSPESGACDPLGRATVRTVLRLR